MLIAKYTANASGVLPTFNDGYQYTINETESNGVYTVEISSDSDFTSCSFNGKTALLTVDYLKVTDKVTNMSNMFGSCSKLTQVDTSEWDTSNVNNMSLMFISCTKLTQLDVSKWDTSKVTNMNGIFYSCLSLTQLDVSEWDTSSVTSMHYMFYSCSKLTQLDVSNFDTSNVTNMSNMFYSCSSLTQLDLSNFDTSNVANMNNMFTYCFILTQLDMSNFNTSKVGNTSNMFQNCSKLQHVGMIYCDNNTVNTIANALPTVSGLTRTIYIQDTTSDICTPRDNIIFYYYTDSRTIISLPQQLNSGDMLTWNDSLRRYIIKKADSRVIEIDTDVKYILDVVGPYYRIETDEKESAPASMTVKLYISKDVL